MNNTAQRITIRLFAQCILLLLIYMALTLLTSVKFLPQDPLASSLPFHHTSGFANVALQLAIITGFIGGGGYIVSNENTSNSIRHEPLLWWVYRFWSVFLILACFAGVFNLLEGRYLLELPPLLDIVQTILLVVFVIIIIRNASTVSAVVLVWAVGMGIGIICILISLLPPADFAQDQILRSLAVNINLNVSYVLVALAFAFWLMKRFSNITQQWTDEGLYILAGLLAIAGVLVSISPLYTFGLSRDIGNITIFLVPIVYLMFAARSYRALADRNVNLTLSGHWYGLGLILLLLGIGFMGTILATPSLQAWLQGTQLTHLQYHLTTLAIVAIIFGVINQTVAEMRAQNARITGLIPLWCITFGSIISAIALGGAGIAQVYLERILTVGYLETQAMLVPIYVIWILALILMSLGFVTYALGFLARRPVT